MAGMMHSLRRWLVFLLALSACLVRGQDAGMVLRYSVGYNTQRASLPLTEDQRKEAGRLDQQARRETAAGRFGEALRRYHEGTAVMRGVPWTPAVELASSLQGRLDRAMVEPGHQITVSLSPLYPIERAAEEKLGAAVFLVPAAGGEQRNLPPPAPVDPARLPFTTKITVPETASGDYFVQVRLTLGDGSAPERLIAAFVKNLPLHIEPLSGEAERLRIRLANSTGPDAPAFPTAQYPLERYQQSDRGAASPIGYDFRGQFADAHAILDALKAGRDPFAGKSGGLRKAYRSPVDQTVQPYRLFIPAQYDGTRLAPLLVALHGMGGDENSMLDGYQGALKTEAQRLGFIVACPKGRDSASMYRGSAEQDVLDVVAEVRRDFRIDAARIYVMGHSMGGFGSWSIAMARPDLFAALGPIAGGGNPEAMAKIRHIPQYVVHGDNDKTVNVDFSRRMVEAGKKAGATIVYVEVPGGGHNEIAAPQFGPMFDFFAKQSRSAGPGKD